MKLKLQPVLYTQRLVLRSIEDEDKENILDLFTDEKVGKTYMLPELQAREEGLPLFEKIKNLSKDDGRFVYGIYANNRLIGLLNDVEREENRVELGYAIRSDYHNQGYATEVLSAALETLFQTGISVVETGAFEENAASIRVMEKCGMVKLDKAESIEYRGKIHRCVYYQKRAKNP